ncbi:MAG: hypothetical protein CENE_03468 [Candidatus Celerinatantimonas neptuna]|nr:MAG: hypothetical protein CENE_03468 [Candidatus Celerinatantimonas neptuna]
MLETISKHDNEDVEIYFTQRSDFINSSNVIDERKVNAYLNGLSCGMTVNRDNENYAELQDYVKIIEYAGFN